MEDRTIIFERVAHARQVLHVVADLLRGDHEVLQHLRQEVVGVWTTCSLVEQALSLPAPPAHPAPEGAEVRADQIFERVTKAAERGTVAGMISGTPTPPATDYLGETQAPPPTAWQAAEAVKPAAEFLAEQAAEVLAAEREAGAPEPDLSEPLPNEPRVDEVYYASEREPEWGNDWWLYNPHDQRETPDGAFQVLIWTHPRTKRENVIGFLDRRNQVARMVGQAHGFVRCKLEVLDEKGPREYRNVLSMPLHTWQGIVNDPAIRWIEWVDTESRRCFRVDVPTAREHAVRYDAGKLLGWRAGVALRHCQGFDQMGNALEIKKVSF